MKKHVTETIYPPEEIDAFIKFFEDLRKEAFMKGWNDLSIELTTSYCYGDPSPALEMEYWREETPKEKKDRVRQENHRKEKAKQQDLQKLKELKEKYENHD